MMRALISISCLILLGSLCTAQPDAPTRLEVEYLPSPVLGLDVAKPRFQWHLSHSKRGQVQSAYQILVSTNPSVSTGDEWDSGTVKSNASSQVEYDGKELMSDTTYYWKVRWWDAQSEESQYSEVAQFDTGLFFPSDWQATWIGGNDQLRTEFSLNVGTVQRARLYIVGLGYYVAWINGRRVGNAVLGTFTTFQKRILYDTYDVTNHVKNGPNALAVRLGNGWYSEPSVNVGPRSLLLQLHVTFSNGTSVRVASSTTNWKTHKGPIVSDNIYIGETYDARLETPGWDMPGYDSAGWAAAVAVPKPTGVLSSQLIQKIEKTDYYTPISINMPAPGVFVFDMGQNMAGWSITKVQGPAGTKITLQHSEMLFPNGTVQNLYRNSPMIDNYILKGEGLEVYEPSFTYHGFRFVQVTGWPGVPNLDSVTGVFIHTALPEVGQVVFSDALLNDIQHMTRFSSLSNFYNIPTDCPQRERRGWLGDAQLSAETDMYNWYMPAAYTKFIQDIQDAQQFLNRAGTVPDCVPFYNHGGAPADPAWGTAYTLLWYWMYEYYGDTRILNEFYSGVKLYLDSLVAATASNGFLTFSRYGDWCSVARGQNGNCAYPSTIVSSFYYVLELEQFAKVAKMIGYTGDQERYTKLANNVRDNWDKVLYNNLTKTYGNGFQTDLVLSLWLDVVPEAKREDTINQLLQAIKKADNHLNTGIVGTKYLLPLLTRLNRTDVAEVIATQRTEPSWGWMQANGATTLWENWPDTRYTTEGSRNHIMFGTQGPWYFRDVGGIGQNTSDGKVGFQHLVIYPRVQDLTLDYAASSLITVKGLVVSSWSKGNSKNSYVHSVTVPVNTVAEVIIDKYQTALTVKEGTSSVWENGKYVPGTPGITDGVDEGTRVRLSLGSGQYTFNVSA